MAPKSAQRQPAADRPGPEPGRPSSESGRPSYEQARDQLTELVKRLEAGGLTLEQSLELWEKGERLALICEEWLEGAKARLEAARPPGESDDDSGTPF